MRNLSFAIVASMVVAFTARAPVIHVHMIGDSTMANKPTPEKNPERGWGQNFQQFFDDGAVVDNHALNGRSTKSFIAEGHWAPVISALQPGDFLIIQFGHNDEKKEDSTRYAAPRTDYRANLARFVAEARAKGATPILCTPIVRRKFNAAAELEATHGEYPDVVRELAKTENVPLLDMERLTEGLVASAGPEGSKKLYVWVSQGEWPAFPAARQDDTHLNPTGATAVAKLAADAIRTSGLSLAEHLRKTE
jgi:lysophospholipase L1-like esterase